MATYYNPKIITNNIEFSVDAANVKSWNGPTPLGAPYGYASGGSVPSPSPPQGTSSERIDFSNDNSSPLVKGHLTRTSYGVRGANNREYAYLGGGNPGSGSTIIDRMDYSNDSVVTVEKGNLTASRSQHGATGTLSYGYFAGGWGPGANEKSSVDRVDYSNDTSTAAPKGPLARGRARFGTIGNQSYGYFAGGEWSSTPARIALIERIDFSNDTASSVDKGDLTTTAVYAGGSGNASYAYFCGGYDDWPSSSNERTTVDRIDYSNDTADAVAKGPLIVAKYGRLTTGDINYGYFCGGSSPSVKSVERIDYSNDTATAVAKGPLNAARYSGAGHGTRFQAIPNTSPLWKDMTGHGHDATVEGATYQGGNGGVWDFDGSGDYISYTDQSPYPLRNWWDEAWTVEYWMKADAFGQSANGGSNVVGVTNLSTTGEVWSFGPEENGEVQWYYYNGSVQTVASGKTLSTGQWYHLVFAFDGSTGMTIFVNGVLEKSATVSGSPTGSSTTFSIGRITATGNDYNGKVALVRIYKGKGFTASEVLNNFNATRTRFGV